MTAYYNENDPYAAAWLRNLIEAGHVAPGDVDTRSIVDVRSADLAGYRQCHFFAGIGGWSFALRLAGWPDDRAVWTGSCPCQPFSAAGRRKGFADERHLWPEFKRLIAERRPAKLYGEQVASAADWLRLVRGDLEAMDYAVGAIPIEAASAGADHLRDRFWFVANSQSIGRRSGLCERDPSRHGQRQPADRRSEGDLVHADESRLQGPILLPERSGECAAGSPSVDMAEPGGDGAGRGPGSGAGEEAAPDRKHWRASGSSFAPRFDGEIEWVIGADGKARRVKSGVRLLANGFPSRVGLLRGFGNAIDPRPASIFIQATS